jgi:hypothetical protein
VQTNYTGAVTDIDESPYAPDANALVASGGIGVMRCSFGTPTTAPQIGSKMLVAVSAQGAAGGNETIVPDSITSNTNFGTNVTDIDEDADSPDSTYINPTDDDGILQVSTGNPTATASIDTTTNAQTVKVVLGKYKIGTGLDAGGSDPTFTLAIYDGATLHETVATNVSVTGTQQTFSYNWTANGGIDPDNIRVHLVTTANGGGPNKRSIAVDTINVDLVFGEPTLNGIVRLFDNAVQMTPSQTFTVAPSEGNKVIELSFTSSDLTQNSDGSTMECYVTQTDGAPSDYIDIEAVEALVFIDNGSPLYDFYMGNSVDGQTAVATDVTLGSTPSHKEYISTSASVIPLKTEYGRVGVGDSNGNRYNLTVYDVLQDAIYDPSGVSSNIGFINPVAYANISSFNLVAKANWDNINGVA